MNNGKAAALTISSGICMISVGVLNILAELNGKIKTFLTLNKAVGPYSGKIFFSIIIWALLWLILNNRLRDKEVDMKKVFTFLIIALLVATLFVFTPFIKLLE